MPSYFLIVQRNRTRIQPLSTLTSINCKRALASDGADRSGHEVYWICTTSRVPLPPPLLLPKLPSKLPPPLLLAAAADIAVVLVTSSLRTV